MPKKLTPPPEAAADLYVRAYRAGLPWQLVLTEAEIHRSTWMRIERRGTYLSSTLERVGAAIDRLLAVPEPAAAPDHSEEMTAHGE